MTKYDSMTDDALRREIAERLRYDVRHELFLFTTVPDWPRDVNAALTLPLPPMAWWHLEQLPPRVARPGMIWHAAIFGPAQSAYGDSPARILCLAWLAMKDGEE